MNPFQIEGPAVISFSGGRTSGYMLRRILDAGLQPDVHVLFANTGKERVETLEFVHECETRWAVPVHWLEFHTTPDRPRWGWQEVSYADASRDGTPFTQLIHKSGKGKPYLPNPLMRMCTQELKIRPMRDWMLAQGYEHWTNVVGLRADEPRRVAKIRDSAERRSERWDIDLPLADAGVTLATVTTFWEAQPFDLQLQPHEGNCDLCFLKNTAKITNLVRDRPDLAVWWIEQERVAGATFRLDRPSYADMLAQPDLFKDGQPDDLIECYCHD